MSTVNDAPLRILRWGALHIVEVFEYIGRNSAHVIDSNGKHHYVVVGELHAQNYGHKRCTYAKHEVYDGACPHCCADCNLELHKCIDCGTILNHLHNDFGNVFHD